MSRFVDEIPVVDETRCTGCGDCVAVCPTDCLELRGHLPTLAWPHDCISCCICAAICPTDAIAMCDPRATKG